MPLQSTSGKALLVPLAALSTDARGVVRVERVAQDGCHTGPSPCTWACPPGGYAEVPPASGTLAAGDRVVVGR